LHHLPSSLGTEVLLEGHRHARDVVPVPQRLLGGVCEPEARKVGNRFLPDIMVNSIDFILAQYLPVHHLAARTVPPDFLLDAMEGEGGRCVEDEAAIGGAGGVVGEVTDLAHNRLPFRLSRGNSGGNTCV